MKFFNILFEGRKEDFISNFSRKFSETNLNRIIDMVLPKYLNWVGKVLDEVSLEQNFLKVTEALKTFEKISSNLPKTDINQYNSLDELLKEINDYKNKNRRDYRKVEGGNVVYEDDRFFIVNPQDHQASCYYGKGTKWCTATENDSNFTKYNQDGKLFYFLDKKLKTDDPFYKVALLYKFEGDKSWWDAKDNSFNKGWILNSPELQNILNEIDNYLEVEYPEQIKSAKDRLEAQKEKERVERLKIARRQRELESEAEDRRQEGEWELGPDCPDEGLKAHALLEWLVDMNDVEVLTNEDRIEIQRLTDEIERLNSEYENSEDVRTDLLDEISDLEDEREELESKIDVYNIVPTDEYYEMTEFEVIDSANLEGRRYVVGTEDEISQSCKDYVDNLIDDIGFEGFNQSFVRSHLDEDAVRDTARDYYEEDVYNNPEVFLDEAERELSNRQVENIKVLRKRIADAEEMIERLEDDEDNEDVIDDLNDKISEYEDEILDIESNPDGDFPDDMIQEKIDDLVEDATYDLENFISEHGLNIGDYVNREEFIDAVIDSDGYGHTINSYDGNADEIVVQGETYWVMRID